MFFRKRQAKPESLPEKLARLLAFHEEMIASGQSIIEDAKRAGNVQLALENYSHLIHDHSEIATMLWRNGDDPREAIQRTHAVYREMVMFRDRNDPNHTIPMERIAGITDWDLVYALFWLVGSTEQPRFHFANLLGERYFAYSRHVLLSVLCLAIPADLEAAVGRFQSDGNGMVDADFRDLQSLLGGSLTEEAADSIIRRVEANWPKRRNARFYHTSAPLTAGHDASNDLHVDFLLACVLKKTGRQIPASPHGWHWG